MGLEGLLSFDTWFYPQIDKQGLIIDVRWNNGGNIGQRLIERLRRKVLGMWRARAGGTNTLPTRAVNGPFVVLANEYSASDSDVFPNTIQLDKLAPVIGMRSWGGVIYIRRDKPLVDGGVPAQPEYAWWDPKQGWSLENRGVIPDIEVPDLPQDVARGTDAQLDRGLSELERLLGERPPIKGNFPPAADRSRKAFEKELPSGG
jgi:tricorn protease